MADLRDPNLKKALGKNSGADSKALKSGYQTTKDRVNTILQNHGLFLPWERRAEIIANLRAGYISFDYLRDRADQWQASQKTRALDAHRGESDADVAVVRAGYNRVLQKMRTMYRSRGLDWDEDSIAKAARNVIAGKRTLDSYRQGIIKVYNELNPDLAVDDIADDADDVDTEDYDLRGAIRGMFPFLADELVDAYLEGWEETGDAQQALAAMRTSPAYERYFPGNTLAPGQFALSEADYLSYQQQARDLMAEYGLPAEYFDRDEDVGRLVAGQVRLSQLEERIRKGYSAALQARPEVRDELSRSFGFGIGDLAAFWLDPTKGEDLLQRKYTEAQIRAASRTTGYGQLDLEDSELLAAQGVTGEQAEQGFGALVEGRGLFEGLIGSREDDIALQDQLGATFLGDAEQRERIRRRAESRIAAFQGGGGGATTQEGNIGLRSSDD